MGGRLRWLVASSSRRRGLLGRLSPLLLLRVVVRVLHLCSSRSCRRNHRVVLLRVKAFFLRRLYAPSLFLRIFRLPKNPSDVRGKVSVAQASAGPRYLEKGRQYISILISLLPLFRNLVAKFHHRRYLHSTRLHRPYTLRLHHNSLGIEIQRRNVMVKSPKL